MARLYTVSYHGKNRLAIEIKGTLVDFLELANSLKRSSPSTPASADNISDVLQNWDAWTKWITDVAARGDLPERILRYDRSEVMLDAPVPRPPKIMCVAFNNRLSERFLDRYSKTGNPGWFLKAPTCVTGTNHDVELPPAGWASVTTPEVELGIIIGRRGRWIQRSKAYDFVAGYTIFNDVTAQDLLVDSVSMTTPERYFQRKLVPDSGTPWEKDQLSGPNRIEMKQWDGFAPTGPCLVTRDEIEDPHDQSFVCKINGQTVMEGSKIELIWEVPEIIHKFSIIMTLEPGDLISTGNVGRLSARAALKPGDIMEITTSRIGTLTNMCVASRYPPVW